MSGPQLTSALTAESLQQTLLDMVSEEIENGYEPLDAARIGLRLATEHAMYQACGGEFLNTHEYWNTDCDYYIDFWELPRPATRRRLHEAARLVLQVTGVTVHLSDCSTGYHEGELPGGAQ